MIHIPSTLYLRRFFPVLVGLIALPLLFTSSARASMIITPTFTSAFVSDFGSNATAAENAWKAAAAVFTSNFSDNIHINITVDAVADTSVFGQSQSSGYLVSYSTLRGDLLADSTTADDATALGAGGSLSSTDPSGGNAWYIPTAEAKAIGYIPDSLTNVDGTTKFGAGYSYTFSGPIASGTYDFMGVAEHEITEVMGRLGMKGATTLVNGHTYTEQTALDAFAFTGANARSLAGGSGNYFSINDGTTLLKLYNDSTSNGLDSRDWAPGTNDANDQFSNPGVVNAITNIDLQQLDVIGYDRITTSSTTASPEPASGLLLATALSAGLFLRRRMRA